VLVVPLLVQMARGYARKPDRAWLYHVPVCWITLWMYGWTTLAKVVGFKQAPVKRDVWQVKGSALQTDKNDKKQVVAPRRHEEHEGFL
jgi:hypothetical protein